MCLCGHPASSAREEWRGRPRHGIWEEQDTPKCGALKHSVGARFLRLCSASARPALRLAAPGSGASRDLRSRRVGGMKAQRTASCPHEHNQTAVPSIHAHPTGTPMPKTRGSISPEALTGHPERLGKESGGRRGWTCGRCASGSIAPGNPTRPPASPPHLPRSTSEPRRRRARGEARAAGAEELPNREQDKPFAKPRVHSSAGPPGCAQPPPPPQERAPRPFPPAALPPQPPRPRPAQVAEESQAHCQRTPRQLLPAPPGPAAQ